MGPVSRGARVWSGTKSPSLLSGGFTPRAADRWGWQLLLLLQRSLLIPLLPKSTPLHPAHPAAPLAAAQVMARREQMVLGQLVSCPGEPICPLCVLNLPKAPSAPQMHWNFILHTSMVFKGQEGEILNNCRTGNAEVMSLIKPAVDFGGEAIFPKFSSLTGKGGMTPHPAHHLWTQQWSTISVCRDFCLTNTCQLSFPSMVHWETSQGCAAQFHSFLHGSRMWAAAKGPSPLQSPSQLSLKSSSWFHSRNTWQKQQHSCQNQGRRVTCGKFTLW